MVDIPKKMREKGCDGVDTLKEEMKESLPETLWNEKIRRCGVVDVIRRDEGELVRDIIE